MSRPKSASYIVRRLDYLRESGNVLNGADYPDNDLEIMLNGVNYLYNYPNNMSNGADYLGQDPEICRTAQTI